MNPWDWSKTKVKLRETHEWTARPGCKVFIAQRGAVRFDFPQEWVVKPTQDSIHLYDKEPPDDDCRLAVSFMEIPPIDWTGLPIATLIESGEQADPRNITSRGEIITEQLPGAELAWRETRFTDDSQNKEACTLMCIARKGRVQALLTFDFWPENRDRCMRIWRTVLNTLVLDKEYDPRTGRVKPPRGGSPRRG